MASQFWDERFGGAEYVYGTAPNDFLREHVHAIPPGRVLCLADGEGRNGVFLAEQGHHVVSVDQSPVGLAKARALAAERGVAARVETIVADLADFAPEPGAFSGVVSIFAHLPPPVRTVAHARAVAALGPRGVFLLEAYTPAQLAHATGGPKDLALLYNLELLRADFAELDLEIARELERDVHEGAFHSGRAAVVQIFARRAAGPAVGG